MTGLSMRAQTIKTRLETASYAVDADAVAEAMLRRRGVRRLLGAPVTRGAHSPRADVPRRSR